MSQRYWASMRVWGDHSNQSFLWSVVKVCHGTTTPPPPTWQNVLWGWGAPKVQGRFLIPVQPSTHHLKSVLSLLTDPNVHGRCFCGRSSAVTRRRATLQLLHEMQQWGLSQQLSASGAYCLCQCALKRVGKEIEDFERRMDTPSRPAPTKLTNNYNGMAFDESM